MEGRVGRRRGGDGDGEVDRNWRTNKHLGEEGDKETRQKRGEVGGRIEKRQRTKIRV